MYATNPYAFNVQSRCHLYKRVAFFITIDLQMQQANNDDDDANRKHNKNQLHISVFKYAEYNIFKLFWIIATYICLPSLVSQVIRICKKSHLQAMAMLKLLCIQMTMDRMMTSLWLKPPHHKPRTIVPSKVSIKYSHGSVIHTLCMLRCMA